MKKKVLITDDDLGIRKFYERELTKEGYDVLVASNGREAIEQVQTGKPDLVIMDIRMPGIDGIQTMVRILEENNEIPVIINSAYSNYRDNFLSWTADAYLVKSSDLTELKSTVKSLLVTR
jgi:DNA-binding response OmpR family regulator